jgi:hypothetical protein
LPVAQGYSLPLVIESVSSPPRWLHAASPAIPREGEEQSNIRRHGYRQHRVPTVRSARYFSGTEDDAEWQVLFGFPLVLRQPAEVKLHLALVSGLEVALLQIYDH